MNRVPHLVDLRISLKPNQDRTDLCAELRIGCAEFDDCEHPFIVRVSRVVLDFDIAGMAIMPGSRYGEPIRQNVVTAKTVEKTDTKWIYSGKASATLSLTSRAGDAKVSADSAAGVDRTLVKTEEAQEDINKFRVRALGGERWSVAEPSGVPLDGTYLDGTESLCSLTTTSRSNYCGIRVNAEIKQKDLCFDFASRQLINLTVSQKKLFNIFVSKILNGPEKDYKGTVIVSQFEVDYEG